MSQTNSLLQQANQTLEEGNLLFEKKEFRKALSLFEKAASLFKKEGDETAYKETLTKIYPCYSELQDWSKATNFFQKEIDGLSKEDENTDLAVFLNIQIGFCGYNKGCYTKALISFETALEVHSKLGEKRKEFFINECYFGLGLVYIETGDYTKAMYNFRAALNEVLDKGSKYEDTIAYYYDHIGTVYEKQGELKEANTYRQKALNLRIKIHGEKSEKVGHTYSGLGTGSYAEENYQQGLQYFQKALFIYQNVYGEEHGQTTQAYLGIGSCLRELKRYEESIRFHQKALTKALVIYGEKHPFIYYFFSGLGNTYVEMKEYHQAIPYLHKTLNACLQLYGKLNKWTAQSYAHIGECLRKQGKYKKAIEAYKQVYTSLVPNHQIGHFLAHTPIANALNTDTLFVVLKAEAVAYFKQYQADNSLITHLHFAFNNCRIALFLVHQMRSSYINEESKVLLAKRTFSLFDLGTEIAFAAVKVAKEQALFFKEASRKVAQNNVILYPSEKFNYLQTQQDCRAAIFQFCEQAKSMVLLANFKEEAAKLQANIPTELLEKEQKLRVERNDLTKKINQEQVKSLEEKDEMQIRKWQNEYFDTEQAYQQLIGQFETDYPQYYQLKHQVETVTIEVLQKKIPIDTALVEYFIGEKYLTIVCITSNDSTCFQVLKPNDFEELIEAFKASIDEMDKSEYLELGYELHELLIAPIGEYRIKNIEHPILNLKIIPAGILNTIPFGALLTEEVQGNAKYADLPYLLLQYDISYHYSATLWSQSMDAERVETHPTFVGFAPVYKSEQKEELKEIVTRGIYNKYTTRSIRIGEETFSELIYSEEEVNSIQSYFNAKNIPTQIFLHTEANTSNFLQNIGKHKYVLISAHGFYNEKQPDLTGIILSPDNKVSAQHPSSPLQRRNLNVVEPMEAKNSPTPERFSDVRSGSSNNIFYLSDAYNLELNADLVVLSCCETGLGKLAIGEGVMALNRGFFYAGAKNVIYTLFKVYDQASCQLTKHLFQYILEEKGYASALKEAKRQLILEGKAPIHWAGYLLIGEY